MPGKRAIEVESRTTARQLKGMGSMVLVRPYRDSDLEQTGRLIADTYEAFNLSELAPERRIAMMGPFAHARSSESSHQDAIAKAIGAPMVLVAEIDGEIVGVLRGGRIDKKGRTVLMSLFVDGSRHRQGIGRKLVDRFEQEHIAKGVHTFKLASTLFAVPFYLSVGYKKTTGERTLHSFGTAGSAYQPMKKVIPTT